MSTISAGTTSTTTLIHSGDTTGSLVLKTNDTGSGGTTAVTIDTSQNVGIGTSSPATKLNVVGSVSASDSTTATKRLQLDIGASSGTINCANYGSDMMDLNIQGENLIFNTGLIGVAERMRIDSSGNVGIGNNSPNAKLQVLAGSVAELNIGYAGTSFNYYDADTQIFRNSAKTERMRIDSSGAVLIGNTSNSSYGAASLCLPTNGEISVASGSLRSRAIYGTTTSNGANQFIDANGYLYRSTSSLKYKTDVKNATHGLAEVMTLRPVTYKGKNDGETVFGGLIAEEVDAAGLTEFVQYADDGTPDALAYGNMVSLCIKAIQEQQALIQQLQADVAALKGTS